MKLGLNGSTTDQCTLEEDIVVADRAGFDILELRTYKLNAYFERHSLEDLAGAFKQSQVQPYAINAIEFFNLKSEGEKEQVLQETEHWCHIASAIDCPYVIAVPSPLTDGVSDEYIIADTVQMLGDMSDIASRYNVNLAFEFIGFDNFSVRTLSMANQIVQVVDRENIGLVVDAYHFYTGGSTLESITQVDQDKLFIFHINDAEDVPTEQLTDAHRLFPGLGVLPLLNMGQALQKIGYDKMMSLELFRPEYWKMEKQDLADESMRHVKNAADKMFARTEANK
ncbi:sugar phosphate isomerase/epimerase family protein [Tuberibacillus sp. Marseille-P3662]|uniref:sugar phosphate isomerase/epimerase family protein n=1 Tax=Tuberibacillus sp. Marseille-P3662 TaxID=1965358 RepID=UPI001594640E|nr:sugar phosphate isomerase/epimerase [Tuberibacillus sp. Marseille-P3662]